VVFGKCIFMLSLGCFAIKYSHSASKRDTSGNGAMQRFVQFAIPRLLFEFVHHPSKLGREARVVQPGAG
jgi:hypothetical protein